MSRQQARGLRNPRGQRGLENRDVTMFPFHTLIPFSGAGLPNLSPNSTISARAATEADAWAHFRVLKFKFRILPVVQDLTAANTGTAAVGYCGGVQDTAPSAITDIMQLLPSVAITSSQQCPTNWVKVPALDLKGPLPWYKTIPGTADSTEEAPGQLVFNSGITNSPTLQIEVKGVFEFKTSVATANTPAAIKARKVLHDYRVQTVDNDERERLIKLLAPVIPGLSLQLSTKTPMIASTAVEKSGNLP